MKIIKLILFVFCVVALSSCFTYLKYDVSKGTDSYLKSGKARPVHNTLKRESIQIELIAPEVIGCYYEKVTNVAEKNEKGSYRCLGFAMYNKSIMKEIREKAKKDGANSNVGIAFQNFGVQSKIALERNLKAYFENVNIKLITSDPTQEKFVTANLDYYSEWWRTDNKSMFVNMQLTGEGADPIIITGSATNKIGNSHLAWMMPLGIITFPIGFLIGSMILNNKEVELISYTAAEALDNAAAEVSKKLASLPEYSYSSPIKIYIAFE